MFRREDSKIFEGSKLLPDNYGGLVQVEPLELTEQARCKEDKPAFSGLHFYYY